MLKTYIAFFCCLAIFNTRAQEKRLKIIHADNTYVDEIKYPGATILSGNVKVAHQGIIVTCKKAIQYKRKNKLNAIGNVIINQGDSIIQRSQYATYFANKKLAVSWGNVNLTDSKVRLLTDTLNFDRNKQILYYLNSGTIIDSVNTLKSKVGNYNLESKKFIAQNNVVLVNPNYTLTSNHLDYYTNSKVAFLYGPSTIKGKESTVYSERGFYNTVTDIAHFIKNAKIIGKTQTIEGDSIYYNKKSGFSSATGNVVVTDSINKTITTGGYAENYEKNDSSFITKRPVAIIINKKDSLFLRADTLLIVGKNKQRILKAFHHVKFYKSDMQGKCDSIVSKDSIGLTSMYKNPILWANTSQITGHIIHFTRNTETKKLDSLKVLNNSLIVQKDSAGYNQIKGRRILGKFTDNDLRDVDVIGNSEVLYYVRDDNHKLIGINKSTSSSIQFKLKNGDIQTVKFINAPDGITYPLSKLPKNARLLRGFIWRGNERPKTKLDIYRKE